VKHLPRLAVPAAALLAVACSGDPKIISATATPSILTAGSTVTVAVVLENVELEETPGGLRAAHEEEETSAHLHTYLDDTETNPLAQISAATFPVVIPRATAAGAHQLIVRIRRRDPTKGCASRGAARTIEAGR